MMRVSDPLYQNALRRQNPYNIVFKGISKFDGQNPIIGSLLAKIKAKNLTDESIVKFSNNASSSKDVEIKSGLEKLRDFNSNLALKNANANANLDSDDNDVNRDHDGDDDLPFSLPGAPKYEPGPKIKQKDFKQDIGILL